MPQLSILIPFTGNEKELESTLVSVLENRPYQCEVIVAHTGDYADPYELGDEVRFIQVAPSDSLGLIVAQVIEEIQAPILHLLSCGTQVRQGWTKDVLDSFDDPYVGSVCPILLNQDESVFCIGVENSVLYRNQLLANGKQIPPQDYGLHEPVGPSQHAGFYRVEAIREITCLGDLSDSLFGLETALSLEAIGYETKVLDSCVIWVNESIRSINSPADSHKALWRFAGSLGFAQGFALSTLGLLCDLLATPFSSVGRRSLISRLKNFIDVKTAAAFREFVEDARGPVLTGQTIPFNSQELSLTGSSIETERRAA